MKKPTNQSNFAPAFRGDSSSAGEGAPVRPWSRQGMRLALKLGHANREMTGSMVLGWALLRMGPHVTSQGEEQVPEPNTAENPSLTPAERRSLREDCGLSLREAAAWHRVTERTISYWEDGTGAPRDGADQDLLVMRARLALASERAVEIAQLQIAAHPEIAGQPVELCRYHQREYPLTQQAAEGLPHGAHNRLLMLTADALARAGIAATIVYRGAGSMDPDGQEGFGSKPPGFIAQGRGTKPK